MEIIKRKHCKMHFKLARDITAKRTKITIIVFHLLLSLRLSKERMFISLWSLFRALLFTSSSSHCISYESTVDAKALCKLTRRINSKFIDNFLIIRVVRQRGDVPIDFRRTWSNLNLIYLPFLIHCVHIGCKPEADISTDLIKKKLIQ